MFCKLVILDELSHLCVRHNSVSKKRDNNCVLDKLTRAIICFVATIKAL